MKTITVDLGERSYPIHVEQGLMKKIPSLLSQNNVGQKWALISQKNVMEVAGLDLLSDLRDDGFRCEAITLPDGEIAKGMDQFAGVIGQMLKLGCDRTSTVLALGGGVVGDVAGFAAATFMRGVDYYQIPTTLLAMVDSSIGGKTGINLPQGKNLVGAIHQPKGVFVDPEVLHSLPREEVISGLGEIIKYGAIRDVAFLNDIASWMEDIDTFPFSEAIIRSCKIKAEIVSRDEREGGLRRILNFGHTVGHALEAQQGYGRLRHGEAIAYGMLCASEISKRIGLLPSDETEHLSTTIHKLPLPDIASLDEKRIMSFINVDKKRENGQLHFVVLEGLGNAVTSTDVSDALIRDSLSVLE